MQWWLVVLSGALAFAVLWLGLIVALWVAKPDEVRLVDGARLLPDALRLLRGLAADRAVSRGVRIRLALLTVYLASPIDLVPDFIPVIGYADDAVVVALALRSAVRCAGPEALERHWPGTADGLQALRRLLRA
ncbi:MAG: YkvA family protein [Angustibacter sp.]